MQNGPERRDTEVTLAKSPVAPKSSPEDLDRRSHLQALAEAFRVAAESGDLELQKDAVRSVLASIERLIDAKGNSYALTHPDSTAAELKQAGRLAIAPALRRYDPTKRTTFITYLLASVDGAMQDEACRAAERTAPPPVEIVAALPEAFVDWEKGVDRKLTIAGVLERLPARWSEIIHLRYWEGMTFDEIGDQFGVSHQAVKQVHDRALARLKDLLGDDGLSLL